MISIQQVINNALNQTKDDMFEIKDLFNDSDWESETPQNRKNLGTQFSKYVKNSNDFEVARRKADNHIVYERL